jgi:EmrB/QacA subfamily drug resistance transporter
MGLSAGQQAGTGRRPSTGWTLVLTSLATFMVALDALVVITALPSIQHDLHASVSTLQWTINAYGLTWAAGIITAAALGDLFGRLRMLLIGIGLFVLSSAVCAVSTSMAMLITARSVQGLGAAIILPLSLTILGGVFPPEKRGTMVGIWGGIGGLAIALGPLVGGALTQSLSWHWVFWINVPIGVVVGVLAAIRIVETRGPGRRLDVVGAVLVTGGAVAIIWSLVRTGDVGWGSAEVLIGLAVGVVLVAAFLMWERRFPEPMLPLHLFRITTFSAANVVSFMMTAALLSGCVYLTQYFQLVRGDSPLTAGVRLLPMLIMPLFVSPVAGLLSDKVGQRLPIVIGMAAEAVGLVWFATAASTTTSYGLLVIPLVLIGGGIAMALATSPTAALSAVPPAQMGKASGANGTLTRFGGAFGVAITTAVFAGNGHLGTPTSALNGIAPALYLTAGFAALAALAGLLIKRRVPVARPPQPTAAGGAPAATAAPGTAAAGR